MPCIVCVCVWNGWWGKEQHVCGTTKLGQMREYQRDLSTDPGPHCRYRKEIPELLPSRVMVSSAMELQFGYSDFCWPWSAQTWKQMQTNCIHDLITSSRVFIFMLKPQYICTWQITIILSRKKPEYPQLELHAGTKMPQVLGSLVYICGPSGTFKLSLPSRLV